MLGQNSHFLESKFFRKPDRMMPTNKIPKAFKFKESLGEVIGEPYAFPSDRTPISTLKEDAHVGAMPYRQIIKQDVAGKRIVFAMMAKKKAASRRAPFHQVHEFLQIQPGIKFLFLCLPEVPRKHQMQSILILQRAPNLIENVRGISAPAINPETHVLAAKSAKIVAFVDAYGFAVIHFASQFFCRTYDKSGFSFSPS